MLSGGNFYIYYVSTIYGSYLREIRNYAIIIICEHKTQIFDKVIKTWKSISRPVLTKMDTKLYY
jgi:hypothetical protein